MTDQTAESTPIASQVEADVPPPATPATDVPPAPNPDPTKPVDTVEFWKRKAQDQEARSKANLQKLKEFEDRDLSELERLKRDNAEYAASLRAAQTESMRNRVALAKQVPPESLTGDDEQQMTASADALLAWRAAAPPAPGSVRPDPSQGARPLSPEQEAAAEYDRYFPPGT